MFGLLVFLALGVYLVVSAWVVWQSARYAKKRGRRGWVWGGVAAFIMYNLVFWDWIPTVATHKYYCANESGFWVYKTLDQWKAENPGVADRLHFTLQASRTSYGSLHVLNERFAVEVRNKKALAGLPIGITEQRLVDVSNGDVLAKTTSVGSFVSPETDGLRGYKFWLELKSCAPNGFEKLTADIEHMGETK